MDTPLESERDRIVRRLKEIEDETDELRLDRKQFLADVAPGVFAPPAVTKPGLTVGKALDEYYALQVVNSEPSSLIRLHSFVRDFKALAWPATDGQAGAAVLAADMPLSVIDAGKVLQVYHFVDRVKGNDDPATDMKMAGSKVRYFGMFRAFVGHCAETGHIPLPLNLHSRRLSWKVQTKAKEMPDWDVVREFLKTLPDRLRLYALLALNTGMNKTDIAHLEERQIDFKRRTLRRKGAVHRLLRVLTSRHTIPETLRSLRSGTPCPPVPVPGLPGRDPTRRRPPRPPQLDPQPAR